MDERVGEFIDAVVEDQRRAAAMLAEEPDLKNARWRLGETALHFLAVEGYGDGVKFLAEAGVDVNATNQLGDTALTDAVTLGNAEIVLTLLEAGADPNCESPTRGVPLHQAIQNGDKALATALLAAGADLNYRTQLGETAHDALRRLQQGVDDIARLLQNYGLADRND